MRLNSLSPSKLKAARLCEARLHAKLAGEIEDESGEGARVGTLAHTAAKHWYRPISFVQDPVLANKYRGVSACQTPDEAFKLAMAELANKKHPKTGEPEPELPGTPSGIQEAKDMFDS